jgi:GNAT superfamily N-acetyltransferase
MDRRFRRARPTEAEELRALTARSGAHWGRDAAYMAEAARLMSLDASDLARDEAWVLEEDETPVGYYRMSVEGERGEIEELFLEPQVIGRGLGRALFEHCVARAKALGLRRLRWTCDRYALGFYLAMGGRRTGTQPSGIVGDDPLTVMELRIS